MDVQDNSGAHDKFDNVTKDALKGAGRLCDAFSLPSCLGFAIFDDHLRYQAINNALAVIDGIPAAAHYGNTMSAKHVAVCFVLTSDGKSVAGFYTLSQYSVDLVKLPKDVAKKLPKYPEAPATLLGRLAVSENFRGQKLGEFLLLDALDRCLRQSSQVASFAVVVDAKDEAAQRFYEHFEFIPLPDTPGRLFLPMRTIEKLFAAN
jgi:predicted GNAT family N-acyltransferase